ncbi:hypothetical protein PENTCL1PPCAC_16523 [Pristionchus entomophagus]|uniref:glutathione transferase n=1 Tax=Pristionchus entomophagus TaxID=358040 RepID=A0AAV5TIY2_9BILA|nr:hypothetical protein PENTCL1PPCAC_16523 [Pristionchus entomophagus]
MPSYKLSYFPARGVAEVSRQMFHLSGTPFEDHRVDMDEWETFKESAPFGQLPLLHVDGKPLPQSFAIARYVASLFGFAGETPFEAAWVDALADQFKDYMIELKEFMMTAYGYAQGDKEKLQKEQAEPAIQKFFAILEKRAKENGSNGHFVGNSLTWIDLLVSDHISIIEGLIPNAVDAFPLVKEIEMKTTSCPKLKEWIDKRPLTNF